MARTIVGLVVGVLLEAEPAFAAVRARCEARVTGREGLSDSQANAFQGAVMAVGAQWAGMAVGARSMQVRTSNLIGDLVARLELNRPEVPASRHMSTVSRAQFNQSN